ncbi:hypothetical protein GCK72_008424 [Caenorhabditis remanei]|uniref:Uncharacterized protein n=1 Tax=Caenorhabditis remanei TaxID=31234 RepID=A0A6A5GXJ6_CAERE|nr:hypothetical protein GCK72_008424 [Caenorhabditis remanei]KAF1760178.1 hypothetical protein GCK72_008424 [Caenorhabditis remanei]
MSRPSSLIGRRICDIVSTWRMVTVCGVVLSESKSTVIPNGIPISSSRLNLLRILLETLSKKCHIRLGLHHIHVDHPSLVQLPIRRLEVLLEIVTSFVCVSDAFDPSVRRQNFSIPAVLSIVSHLVREMLTEPETTVVDTDFHEELMATGHYAKTYIGNSLSNSDFSSRCAIQLIASGEQNELLIGNFREFREALVLWIDKVLDFTHGEFTNMNESLTGRDLISEAKTDLSGGERKFSIIELEKSLEVHEDSLSGFWAEDALKSPVSPI